MLRIRLRRVGKKKQPQYRIVVADSRAPRDGAFLETIGTYNPLTEPATINVEEDRAREWLSKGAVPSERVVRILASKGLVPAPVFTEKRKQKEAAEAAKAPAAAATPAAQPAPEPAAAEA